MGCLVLPSTQRRSRERDLERDRLCSRPSDADPASAAGFSAACFSAASTAASAASFSAACLAAASAGVSLSAFPSLAASAAASGLSFAACTEICAASLAISSCVNVARHQRQGVLFGSSETSSRATQAQGASSDACVSGRWG
jgi:hypothetical protein